MKLHLRISVDKGDKEAYAAARKDLDLPHAPVQLEVEPA
jgi:hypothetical protein